MKRKSPTPSSSSTSTASFFAHQKVLILEDGRDIDSKVVGPSLVKRIQECGGQANILKTASFLPAAKMMTEEQRDAKMLQVTHLVVPTTVNLKQVLEGMRLLPTITTISAKGKTDKAQDEQEKEEQEKEEEQQPGGLPFKIVTRQWVTACLTAHQQVDTKPYELSPSAVVDVAAAAAPRLSSTGPGNHKTARTDAAFAFASGGGGGGGGAAAAGPPSLAVIEARLAPFPNLDPETRRVFNEYGGPLVITKSTDFPKFACERPAPRQHANTHLTPFFEELMDMYLYALGQRTKEGAFGRVVSVLRAWPTRITSAKEVQKVQHVGDSSTALINEILTTGRCERLEGLKADPKNMALLDLCRIHQVGHSTAIKWYDAGYQSVEQILAEIQQGGEDYTQTNFYQLCKPSLEQAMGLVHFHDYSQRMSRAQVEGVAALVREAALKALQEKGLGPETLLFEICGGYRRGKEENGDADVLVSCTQAEGQNGLREAMKRIFQEEMKLDMIYLKEGSGVVQGYSTSSSSSHEKVETSSSREEMESHDNTLTLIKYEGVYRRLDIISPPPDQWAFGILGWSGNRQMEKDLRSYATEKGFSLSQKALRKNGKRVKNPKSEDGVFHTEEEIWDYMGLKFLHPRLRWA